MDYLEVQTTAYGYADRTDTETIDRYDDFLRIVEARINKVIKTLKMSTRATTITAATTPYYGLPEDFTGMRDLRIEGIGTNGEIETTTCQYKTPAQINEVKNINGRLRDIYYSIIADQIHIQPPQDNKVMEMTYYKKVPALTPTADTNWMGDENPDCYVFGVLTEINAFNKDYETAAAWDKRFNESLSSIENNDTDIRWDSGNAMTIRTL